MDAVSVAFEKPDARVGYDHHPFDGQVIDVWPRRVMQDDDSIVIDDFR